jgi:iron complex outermembrane receptor protein
MKIGFKALAMAGASLCALAGAGVATPSLAADADAAAADAAAATGLQEVVVTAERRETNAQKTPISISVVTDKAIESRHVYSISDLSDGSAPGLTVTPYASRPFNVILNIRGVGVMTDTNQPSGESGVGVYIDGVYLGRPQGLDAGLYDISSIEVLKGPQGTLFGRNSEGGALNITVKKPTGKFGMDFLGGAGNYGSYEGHAFVDFASFNNFAVKVDGMIQYHGPWVNNPMPGQHGWNEAGRRGFRFQTRWSPNDKFTADYAFDIGHTEDTTVFGYVIRPANNVTISPLSPISTSRIAEAPVGTYLQPSLGDQWGHNFTMKWDAAPWVQVKSITSYRDLYQNQYQAPGTEGLPITQSLGAGQNFERYSLAQFRQHQYSEEVQAIGSLDRLKFIVGAMYWHEETTDQAQAFNVLHWDTAGINSGITPITYSPAGNSVLGPNACIITPSQCTSNYNNFYNQPHQTTLAEGLYPNIGIDRASTNKTSSYGIYGQGTYTPPILNDRIHLSGGLRWNTDAKDGVLFIVNNALPFLPDASGQTTNVQGRIYRSKSWSRVDPMVNLAFDITPTASFYAKWSTGYRAGGFNSRSITYSVYDPEEISMYEAGVKSEWWDHRIRFNVTGYYGDYKNVYYNISANYNTFATNAAGQLVVVSGSTRTIEDTYNMKGVGKVSGVETEFDFAILDGLTASGTYTYAYTKMPYFTDPVARPQINAAGVVTGYALNTPTLYHQLYTPANRITAQVDYQRTVLNDKIFQFHLDGNWNDGQYSSTGDVSTGTKDASGNTIYLPQLKSQAGWLFNGRIALSEIKLADTGERLTLSLWARNLFNSNLMTSRSGNYALPSSSISASFADPRTFGGQLAMKF